MSRVGLVIPAWNEPEAIGAVLDEVPAGSVDEVVVVVGSNTDCTASIAERHGARALVQQGRGYGAACWSGARLALEHGAEIVAFLDGDYADPPAALPTILEPIQTGRADLVLGCRDLRRHPDALPRHARAGNALICTALNVCLGAKFRDLPSYKAISGTRLLDLQMHEMTYGWTVEMLAKSARRGMRIQQVDVDYRARRGGTSKVSGDPRASILAGWKLLTCAVSYSV